MKRNRCAGVTLIELVMVIVIMGIMATSVMVFFKPASDGFFAARDRATLIDSGDAALRRISRDVSTAIPNSIRMPNNQCFELVPTSMGGRYRAASDSINDLPGCTPSATCSAPLDITSPVTVFDALSDVPALPALGDWIVIGNQNGNDVYTGASSAKIVASPSIPARPFDGTVRITIGSKQFSSGYDQNRFYVVPHNGGAQTVVYVCSAGMLYRVRQAFSPTYPTTCPATTGGVVMVKNVKACNFVYNANQGATQESGWLWAQLDMATSVNSETVTVTASMRVVNLP